MADALHELAGLGEEALAGCRASEAAAEQLLTWELTGGQSASARYSLKISPGCLGANPAVVRVVQAILRASLDSKGPVKCD